MERSAIEDRVNQSNNLGVKFHAPRALDNRAEFEGLQGDELRSAVKNASFRNEGSHLGEAVEFRQEILRNLCKNTCLIHGVNNSSVFRKFVGDEVKNLLFS